MTRESFGTSLSRLAALAFALVAAVAVALAIAPGTALAAETIPPAYVSPDGAGTVESSYDNGAYVYTATPAEGYKLVSWKMDNGHGTITTQTGDFNPFRVTGDLANITAVFEQAPTPPTAAVDPSGAGTVTSEVIEGGFRYTATANEGWEFSQWNVVYGEGGAAEQTDNPLKVDTNVQEVTAYFKKKETPTTTYKITVTDDGNGTAKASVAEAAAGTKVQLTATPKDRSYVFDKWVSDDVSVEGDAFEMPAKNVTVKATFKSQDDPEPAPVKTNTITFDANGGAGSMDALTNMTGATVTLTTNAFTRDGYTFAGWNTAKDGSGTAYADKAEVKLDGDMTLYAQWKANASTSGKSTSNTAAKTGDTTLPMTVAAIVIAAIAVGILLVARRRIA